MKSNKNSRIIFFSLFLIVLITYIYFVFTIGADTIVSTIGVENSYLIIFLAAIIGGVSSLTSTSFYAVIITFLISGNDFVILSIIGAIGLTIGDSVFYYLGYKGRDVTKSTKYEKYVKKLHSYINSNSKFRVFLAIIIYAALPLPLPKDIISAGAGIIKYDLRVILSGLAIGNLLHLLIVSILFLYFSVNVT